VDRQLKSVNLNQNEKNDILKFKMAKIEERYHKRELKLKVKKGGPAATDDESRPG
jgi:hypothetical protein